MISEPFFLPLGDGRFAATEQTRGPWSDQHQHGGPPAALLAHGLAALLPAGVQIARITFELPRPVPIAALQLRAEVVRAGRAVTTLTGTLTTVADGTEVMRASALAMRTLDPPLELPLPPGAAPPTPPRPPGELAPYVLPFFTAPVGYHTAMELRFAAGSFGQGPTQAWMRMRVPLLEGSAPTPLERVLCAADSGNGVSLVLDVRRFTFVNPDLTVALWRLPVGEWICLDARTSVGGHGLGLADTLLWDEQGPIGRGAQTLLVAARQGP